MFSISKQQRRIAKTGFAIFIGLAIAGALRSTWPPVRDLAGSLSARWLWIAFGLALVYRVLNAAGWGIILRALGARLPVLQGIRLWLVAETMRWLPGSVWSYCSRVYQAQRAGVPAGPASLSMPLELVVTVVAWSVAALVGGADLGKVVLASVPHVSTNVLLISILAFAMTAMAGIFLLYCHPEARLVKKAGGFVRDLFRIFQARPRPSLVAGGLIWFVMLCLFNGVAFYALLKAFPVQTPRMASVIGINSIGWLVGFFAVFSPGGLGVREGGMSALLVAFLPIKIAIGSVVLWRVIQIIVEVICLGACYAPSAFKLLTIGARQRSASCHL